MITIVAVIIVLLVILTPIVLLGRWITGPLEQAAKNKRERIRFTVSDLLCLVVNIQLPMAIIVWLVRERTYSFPLAVVGAAIGLFGWSSAVVRLSRAGITTGRHRVLFLGVVVPMALYGIPFFIVLAIVGIFPQIVGRSFYRPSLPWTAAWFLTGIALMYCGLYTRRIVSFAERQNLDRQNHVDSTKD